MKRLFIMIMLVAGIVNAHNNPTAPNSSYKNTYPKGAKASKEILTDKVDRNYKKQGTLKINRTEKANVRTGAPQKSYKHAFGL